MFAALNDTTDVIAILAVDIGASAPGKPAGHHDEHREKPKRQTQALTSRPTVVDFLAAR